LEDAGVEAVLEAHCRHRNFRGVRQILNWDPNPLLSQCARVDYLGDRRWCAGFALLGRYGLSFDLQAHPWQMPEAASLARAFPEVQVVVDHLGMPAYRGEAGWDSWRAGVEALAGCANVSVKLSGFGMFDPAWTAASIRPEVELILDRFGVDRCMFGSNFPVDKRWKSFVEVVEGVDSALVSLSPTERDAVFARNAIRIYRLAP